MTDRRIDDEDDIGITMRRRPLWDGRITFGNLLTMIGMAIGGASVYVRVVTNETATNERLQSEVEIRKVDEENERRDMRNIASGLQNIDTKIEDVRRNIDDVRERLGGKADRK